MKSLKKFFVAFSMLGLCITGCSKGGQQSSNNADMRYAIYQLAVADGYEGTYQEWLASIKGEKGDTGAQGEPGKDGQDGHTPVITIGSDGYWYIDGDNTHVKAQGEKGDTGAQGPKGDVGSQGPKGDTGETGPQGPAGQNGTNGKDGTDGKDGQDGLTPYIGPNGHWWIGTTDTGIAAQGPAGQDGANGKDGRDGVDGQDGTDGANGSNGKDGVNGQDGLTPYVGSNGHWWIGNTDTGVNAQGPAGQDGKNGADGKDGADGKNGADGRDGQDGSSVLTGSGAPSSSLGKDGDSYIDLSSWDYYLKNNGSWVKQGNIKGDKGEDGTTYIPVIFNNWDGSKLYEFYYEKGSTVSYDGPTPTRPSDYDGDEELPYTFRGWDKPLENIQQPTIFTAQYREKMYNVTFKNYDGSELYSSQVERGHDAIYEGQVPSRNDNPNLVWTFIGWDKPLTNIKKDTVFVAQFYAPNAVECVFQNYDGTILSTQYIGTGESVVYEGTTPIRNDDYNEGVITKYDFIGWDKSLVNITVDTVFVAQYGSNEYYEVKFVNYDGSVLYTTSTFNGGNVTFNAPNPVRPQEANGTNIKSYTFTGWDKSLTNITQPTTITALYSTYSFTGYKVTFLDNDSSELYSYYFEENKNAYYPLETPFSYDSENVRLFIGWSNSLENITGELTVTAKYQTIKRGQNGEYPQTKVTDEALIASLNRIDDINSKGYYEYGGEQYEKNYGTYYKIEPIHWRYLDSDGSSLFVTSEYLLSNQKFNKNSYSNNYKNSTIREWLNSDFLNKAFTDDSYIITSTVDNSESTTGYTPNSHVCETTYDKLFLLSYQELYNSEYGFTSNQARSCKATDYATSSYCSTKPQYFNCGPYWTRSPRPQDSSTPNFVDFDGRLLYNMGTSAKANWAYGVRPALRFEITD